MNWRIKHIFNFPPEKLWEAGRGEPVRISPVLIIIGGYAGTGKTAISKRLSAEFGIPRLGSDTLGRTIKQSIGTRSREVNAYWIAYEVLFCLCREFLETGVSTILDLTMGWEFQWQQVDSITQQYPQVLFLPIILRCPREVCLDRIRQRYEANPTYYDPSEVYLSEPKNSSLWIYLAQLDHPAIHFVDANRPHDEVYQEVRKYVSVQLDGNAA